MVAANAVWHAVFQRLLEHLLYFQVGGGYSLYMHPDTRSVKCTFSGANPQSDVVCVCVCVCVRGTCGSKRGVRQWVPLDWEAVCKWPQLGLKSRATFESFAARRKALKDKGKGKGRVGPIPQSRFSNPGTMGIVPHLEGEDSAASFQGPTGLNEHRRVQPVRRSWRVYPLLIATLSSDLCALMAVVVVAVAAAAAAAAAVIVGAGAILRIMIRMMMMCTYLVAPQ